MKLTLVLPCFCALSLAAALPVSAQERPKIIHYSPSVPGAPAVSATPAATPTGVTKVVRIYRGQGFFDPALAQKLRPVLAQDLSPATGEAKIAKKDDKAP